MKEPYDPGRAKEYSYDEVAEIPKEMGTYRFIKNGKIMYIGISINLRRRIKEHKKNGVKFHEGEIVSIKVAKKCVTYDEIRRHEERKITDHNPERNERAGGGGRTPKLDVD